MGWVGWVGRWLVGGTEAGLRGPLEATPTQLQMLCEIPKQDTCRGVLLADNLDLTPCIAVAIACCCMPHFPHARAWLCHLAGGPRRLNLWLNLALLLNACVWQCVCLIAGGGSRVGGRFCQKFWHFKCVVLVTKQIFKQTKCNKCLIVKRAGYGEDCKLAKGLRKVGVVSWWKLGFGLGLLFIIFFKTYVFR